MKGVKRTLTHMREQEIGHREITTNRQAGRQSNLLIKHPIVQRSLLKINLIKSTLLGFKSRLLNTQTAF